MTAVLLGHFAPDSPEWHAARADGIGGSEIGAVLGLSRFESPFSLWHRKNGNIPGQTVNAEMSWGTRLEPVILATYRALHPEFCITDRGGTWASVERPWQIANPDLAGADEIVEAKFSPYGDGYGPGYTDEAGVVHGDPAMPVVPPANRCQCIWYGDVLGVDRAVIVVLIGGFDYREYVIEWTPAEAQMLRDAGTEFMASLAAGTAPSIDDHTETWAAVRELHPDIDPEDHDLDGALARQFIDAKRYERDAKAAARLATSLVADAMGNARRARWDDTTIATRQSKGGAYPHLVIGRGLLDDPAYTPTPTPTKQETSA